MVSSTLSKLLTNVTKVGVAAVAVNITYKSGLWSDSAISTNSFAKVKHEILQVADASKIDVPEIPEVKSVTKQVGSAWNTGVKTTFSAIYTAPEKCCNTISNFATEQWKNYKS